MYVCFCLWACLPLVIKKTATKLKLRSKELVTNYLFSTSGLENKMSLRHLPFSNLFPWCKNDYLSIKKKKQSLFLPSQYVEIPRNNSVNYILRYYNNGEKVLLKMLSLYSLNRIKLEKGFLVIALSQLRVKETIESFVESWKVIQQRLIILQLPFFNQ